MERRNEMPPTHTVRTIDTPPDSGRPTVAQLKADIDSGRTGDKTAVFDPGLSPLGTDDEAAGTPNEPHRVRLARRMEGVQRWASSARRAALNRKPLDPVLAAFIGGGVLIGCVLAVGITWGRSW